MKRKTNYDLSRGFEKKLKNILFKKQNKNAKQKRREETPSRIRKKRNY